MNHFGNQIQNNLSKIFTYKKVIYSFLLGCFFSLSTKGIFTPIILNGKSFVGRSEWIQIAIVVVLAMFYSIIFVFLSAIIPSSFYSKLILPIKSFRPNQFNRDQKIQFITGMIIIGFLLSVLFHVYQGEILKRPYPYTTFLFLPTQRFSDFTFAQSEPFLNPYFNNVYQGGQFPLAMLIYFLFTSIPLNISLLIFLILCSTAFAYLTNIILWGKKSSILLRLNDILPLVFLTYPFLIAMDRGNLEILLFVFLLFFLFFFLRERYTLSAVFLALAIAMKGFPAVLLLIYIPKKKYLEIVMAISIATLLTLGSLALFKGGFMANLNFLLHGPFFSPQGSFVGQSNFVQRGVSLFTFFKIIFIETGLLKKIDMMRFLSTYIKLAALSFIPLAAYVVFIEKILWRRVALLVFSMLLLPQISADYKLLHVYLPMFLFLLSEDHSRADFVYLIIFGLLMIPKDYTFLPHVLSDSGTHDISISIMINILSIIAASVMIIISGTKEWLQRPRN